MKEKDYCLYRWAGSEFQFEGPAYANEHPPYEASFTRGKSRSPRSADRRWWRPEMPETGWHLAVGQQVFRSLVKKGKASSLDIAPLTILNSGTLQPRKWQLTGTEQSA